MKQSKINTNTLTHSQNGLHVLFKSQGLSNFKETSEKISFAYFRSFNPILPGILRQPILHQRGGNNVPSFI